VLKKKLLLALVALLPSYSYSDSIVPYYGQTGNAALGGNTWSMDNILPGNVPGLDINGVLYNYTIQKPTDESVSVHIQNERANGNGYIFRETDDWLPGSLAGTRINKVVPVVPSNRELWGDGSIEVDGNGSVTDPRVVYTYKVDPCYNPQFDPNCPGYVKPMPTIIEVDVDSLYNVMNDENVDLEQEVKEDTYEDEDKKELSEEEKKEKQKKEEEKKKERLEKALAAADNSALFAQALANSQMLSTMNLAVNMNSYYTASIPGGSYNDSVVLVDKQIPENKRGLRNGLAQQLLHEKMVDMQY